MRELIWSLLRLLANHDVACSLQVVLVLDSCVQIQDLVLMALVL